MLGAGGSARAAVWALREAGAEVSVWNRTPERASALADEFQVRAVARPVAADVLVNCTSVGLQRSAKETTAPSTNWVSCTIWSVSTPMSSTSSTETHPHRCLRPPAAGARTLDGLEVLVAQGALSFELWTGRAAPLDVMRRAARGEEDSHRQVGAGD